MFPIKSQFIPFFEIHPVSVLVPSAGPFNITARSTSSSSIVVSWGDVPIEHQNGIITGYRVYFKKDGSKGKSFADDTSNKQFSKSGLDPWTFYNITVSAKTSVGEGLQSALLRVQTDEDGKKNFGMSSGEKY